MKFLITGFSPFGGETINPALEIINKLADEIDNNTIITGEIPTVFGKSITSLSHLIDTHKPDVVLCLGQAGGIDKIRIERIAINLDEARIPDNDGNQPSDAAINSSGENAYFTNLPTKAMVKSLHDQGIPATLSYSAGTFVCNHLFYGLMDHIITHKLHIRGGFIHVPYVPKQAVGKASAPSMSIDLMIEAIETLIRTLSTTENDIEYTSGTLH